MLHQYRVLCGLNSLTYLEPSARSFSTYSCSSGALHSDANEELTVKKRTVKYTLPLPKETAVAITSANVASGTHGYD
jgi:hypothetical protein